MYKYLVLGFLMSACGDADLAKSVKAVDGIDGQSCTVEGSLLKCADGSSYNLAAGDTVTMNWTLIQNADGSVTIKRPGQPDVTIGEKGAKGDPGQSGRDGKDACTPKFWIDESRCVWVKCGDKTEKLGKL